MSWWIDDDDEYTRGKKVFAIDKVKNIFRRKGYLHIYGCCSVNKNSEKRNREIEREENSTGSEESVPIFTKFHLCAEPSYVNLAMTLPLLFK